MTVVSVLSKCVWSLAVIVSVLISPIRCNYNPDVFQSLLESTATDRYGKLQTCLGDCYGNRQQYCRIDWGTNDVGDHCQPKDNLVPNYFSKYSHGYVYPCLSNCDKFDGYKYDWCLTNTTWYECFKDKPLKVKRKIPCNDHTYFCNGECNNDGWCYKYPSSWDYCKKTDVVYITDNPTVAGTRCVTLCGASRTTGDSFQCYDENKSWEYCYPSPDPTHPLLVFHKRSFKRRGYIDINNKYISCRHNGTRGKRSNDDDNNDGASGSDGVDPSHLNRIVDIFDGTHTVEAMATYLEGLYPTEQVRWFEPNIYPDPSFEPLIQYTAYVPSTAFSATQAVLPLVIRASYTSVTRAYEHRGSYNEVAYQMLDPQPNDEHGHMVSHHLGGTEDPHNIVPQARDVNRGSGSEWSKLEKIIREYFDVVPDGTVDQIIVLNYRLSDSNRPTMFATRVRFYDGDRKLVDRNGNRLSGFLANEFENVFIANKQKPC